MEQHTMGLSTSLPFLKGVCPIVGHSVDADNIKSYHSRCDFLAINTMLSQIKCLLILVSC